MKLDRHSSMIACALRGCAHEGVKELCKQLCVCVEHFVVLS